MTDFDTAFASRATTDARQFGAPQALASSGEIWNAMWGKSGLNSLSGVQQPIDDANDALERALAQATGKRFEDMAETITGTPRAADDYEPKGRAAVLASFAQTLEPDQRAALGDLADPLKQAERAAGKIERDAAQVMSRSYGLSGHAIAFAASAARMMTDPVNLMATVATLPFGGAAGMSAVKFAGREFLSNAAAQALQEPDIQRGRAALGLDHGLADAVENIAMAGVAGAALHPLIYLRAGASSLRARLGKGGPADAAETPHGLQAGDLDAVAAISERNAALEAQARNPVEAARMHGDVQQMVDAINGGTPLPEIEPVRMEPAGARLLDRHRVTDADGRLHEVEPVVVEARDLLSSSDAGFDAMLQPRDRSRAASGQQIREMANRLDPERLGLSSEADRGAPIIGPDMMVESGNGRVLAIREAYAANGEAAARYRAHLTQNGVDVSAFSEPVLVRRRLNDLTPEQRQSFVVAANRGATLAFSATERALADAATLSVDRLAMLRAPHDLGAAANRDFHKTFVASLPQSEHGALVTATGELSAEGMTRMRNAVVASAYGDAPVLARIGEATADDIKSISNALVAVAPDWAKLRADVKAGAVRGDLDATDHLMQAVEKTAHLRSKGQKLVDYLAQQDAFDPIAPEVEGFMRMFTQADGRRAASAERMADAMRFYAEEARKVSSEAGLDLGLAPVQTGDLVSAALRKGSGHVDQGQLFAADARTGAGDGASRPEVQRPGADRGRADAGSSGQAGDGGQPGTEAAGREALSAARQSDIAAGIERHGDLLTIDIDGKTVSAKEALAVIARDRDAASEVLSCLGGSS